MIKKAVIVGHENYGTREIFTEIVKNHPDVEFLLVITTGLYYRKSFFQSVFKMLREASFWFCLERFIELRKYMLKGDTLMKRAKKFNVKTYFTADINSTEANNFLKSFSPDVILSTFTMNILKNNTINLPKIAAIGCHPSILPEYRGLEVFFWALANEEKTSGVSVFFVTEKVDFGKVIMQEKFDIDKNETVDSIYVKLTKICARLMSETLRKLKNNEEFTIYPLVGKGSYYPMPTREAYRKFKRTGRKWK